MQVPAERKSSAAVVQANADPVDPDVLVHVNTALAAAGIDRTDTPAQDTRAVFPMLAINIDPNNLPNMMADPQWVMQPKLDGDRLIVDVYDGHVQAFNRNGQPKASNVGAAMLAPFRGLTEGRWAFDGEVVGRTLWLFDLIHAPGWITPDNSFLMRYAALEAIVGALPSSSDVVQLVTTATSKEAKRMLLADAIDGRKEGVMFRLDQPYEPGRSSSLLRHKFTKTLDAEVVAVGGKSVTSYVATFTPEVWLNDYATAVDPQGDTVWTISEENRIAAEHIVAADPNDGLDRDDALVGDLAAPQWVHDWTGPRSVNVEAVTVPEGKQSAVLAVYDNDGAQVRVGNVTTIGKGGPGGVEVGDVVEVKFLYIVNPEAPVLYQPRIVRVRTDKAAPECSVDQLVGAHTDRSA